MRHLVGINDVSRPRCNAFQPRTLSKVARTRLKFDVIVVVSVAGVTNHFDLIALWGDSRQLGEGLHLIQDCRDGRVGFGVKHLDVDGLRRTQPQHRTAPTDG